MKYFRLKLSGHRWWHWIVRPIKTWKLKKYLQHTEKVLLENIDFDKVIKAHTEFLLYGHTKITDFLKEEENE